MSGFDRRKFITGASSAVAALGTGLARLQRASRYTESSSGCYADSGAGSSEKPVIGIQIDAVSSDEGTEKVLDILQEKGGVNALYWGHSVTAPA